MLLIDKTGGGVLCNEIDDDNAERYPPLLLPTARVNVNGRRRYQI